MKLQLIILVIMGAIYSVNVIMFSNCGSALNLKQRL